MTVIDSDAHVIETERTWDFMLPSDSAYRPEIVTGEDGVDYWMIEGKNRGRARGPVAAKGIATSVDRGMEVDEGKRLMEDIPGRIAHMDELNIDVQVLYSTMYISRMCDKPETEVALSRGYNRWLADIWKEGQERLRWAVIPPLMSMEKALEELHFGKEHGACAVFMRGIEGDLLLSDPYLFPLYEEAQKLDLAIGVHAAAGSFERMDREHRSFGLTTFKFPTVGAFSDLVLSRTPERFPDLRWTFVEVTSQWLPYVMNDISLRSRRLAGHAFPEGPELLRENRLYVACQTIDDLGYVVDRVGDDNLIIGTDYGHRDTTAEIDALRKLRDDGKVGEATANKILSANPKRLYGL